MVTQAGIRVSTSPGPARLLSHVVPSGGIATLRQHRQAYPHPHGADPDEVRTAAAASGLGGRGGAGFPIGRKLASVSELGGHIVVVNATEGEPASQKDRMLLTSVPHLVLDGAELAARAVSASQVVVCVDWTDRLAVAAVKAAIAERTARGEPEIQLALTPPRYVAGEESALVNFLNGGPSKPTASGRRPYERGVNGRPTLVNNAETLAQLTLAHRYGPEWFRSCGTPDEPGTRLFTITSGGGVATVVEAPVGVTGLDLLDAADAAGRVRSVLVGGYFGTWMRAADFGVAAFSRAGLAPYGAGPGAGIVIVLPHGNCVLAETARLLSWYAAESSGQCGPCVFGLPALAEVAAELARGTAGPAGVQQLLRWAADIDGRGACRHPDGAVRLLRSALAVAGDDLDAHVAGQPCPGAEAAPFIRAAS